LCRRNPRSVAGECVVVMESSISWLRPRVIALWLLHIRPKRGV
jgi:hypothetical protein